MTHIVMSGTDISMFTNPSGSETLQRFEGYADVLNELRPGSTLTFLATGAPANAHPIKQGNVTILPIANLGDLYKALKSLPKIDVITTQTCTEESWQAYAFALPRRIPVVPQEHGDPFNIHRRSGAVWRRSLLRLRDRLGIESLRLARGVRVVSPDVAQKLKAHLKGKPLAVLPVPVSISALPRQETTPLLFFVGRLDEGKNVDGFLKAAALIRIQQPDIRIEIAGDGPLRSELEKLAASLGLGDITTFHGWVDYHQLAACYARASLFFLPSWHEAFGRVILESLICGAPVIASNTAGPSFILAQDQAGILIDPADTEGMARKAIELLENPAHREELRQRGYRTAARFSREQMSRDWMQFLLQFTIAESA